LNLFYIVCSILRKINYYKLNRGHGWGLAIFPLTLMQFYGFHMDVIDLSKCTCFLNIFYHASTHIYVRIFFIYVSKVCGFKQFILYVCNVVIQLLFKYPPFFLNMKMHNNVIKIVHS